MTASVTEKEMNIFIGRFCLKNCFLLSFELLYVHLISNTEFKDSSYDTKGYSWYLDVMAGIVVTSLVPVRS